MIEIPLKSPVKSSVKSASAIMAVANSGQAWHQLEASAVLASLETVAAYGLDETVAAERLERDGPNALLWASPRDCQH